MLKEVTDGYQASRIEDEARTFWEENKTYDKVRHLHSGDPAFFFVDGPPYTTGHIHLGTAWNKIIKDSLLRYRRMTGRHVIDRAGYDMHGLPIEVRVEQSLGFHSKKDIEAYGIERFIDQCREFALKNKDVMSDQFRRLGVWMDFSDPYQTLAPEYVEAAWWTLKKADEKKMLERGHRVVNWCPRCETAIADAEVEYWDETDPSLFVKFPVAGKEHEYLVIWTTTPWTLPANVAVAVSPEVVYARVRAVKDALEEYLWIAEDLVTPVLKKGRYKDFTLLERKPGRDLVGMVFSSPLEEKVPLQKTISHRVVTADFVTVENTGLVHIAPGHGWDDYMLGVKEGLDVVCPVDGAGRFTDGAGSYCTMPIRDANEVILGDLGDNLLARDKVTHRYGHCWRCKTPIIFRATSQWFLKASGMRDLMLDEVARVAWYPEWAGSARFYDWIKEARDWCISRQRYWGIPIPVWECGTCLSHRVIGTRQELEEACGSPVPDPHRPHVDRVTIPCTCGGEMRRVEDIFDVWFDSAVASWATLGFPGKVKEFEDLWPADFITEGQDQTRGWFYSQLGASTIAFGKAPYKSVLMHGFALDAEGRKMSKSLGNVVTPEEVVSQFGVDVLRFYVLSANAPWDDLKFNWDGVRTVQRTMNILWNVYRFPLPYMTLDGFVPTSPRDTYTGEHISTRWENLAPEDRFIVSRVNNLAKRVTASLGECLLHKATRDIAEFILEDLSRWYIQLVRPRMWTEEDDPAKRDAYETMYYVMRRLVVILCPFAPHIAEVMYGNLRLPGEPESVHMLEWFSGEGALSDGAVEQDTAVVRAFDEAVANARQAGKRKLRWPVGDVVVATSSDAVAGAITRMNALCCDRANARKVGVVRGAWERVGWQAEPVMKALGPGFGKDAPKVKQVILESDGTAMKRAVSDGGSFDLRDGDRVFTVTEAHVTFVEKLPKDVFSAQMAEATVYVDVSLDPGLEAEGYSREIIRRIQEMRRQLGLRVEDFIRVAVTVEDGRVAGLVGGQWKDRIAGEVRAKEISIQGAGSDSSFSPALATAWDIEGIPVSIGIGPA